MALQSINLGATGTGAGGDTARTAFEKLNANFSNPAHAASKLAQQSPTDSATGMLLAYGAFGLGKQIYTGQADANVYESSGFYGMNSGTPADFQNFPVGASPARGMLIATGDTGSAYCAQIFLDRIYNKAWFRTKSGTWSGWVGLTVERGSNANGSYVRLPDGTQICWVRGLAIDVTSSTGAGLFRGFVTWTFPASFASSAELTANSNASVNHSEWGGNATGMTSTSCLLRLTGVASRASQVDGVAFGRWY